MKWLKRVAVVLGVGLILAVGLGAGAYFIYFRGTPDWYLRHKLDPAALAAAAQRATNKMAATIDWASGSQASQDRQRYAGTSASAATAPAEASRAVAITFTEEELNGFLTQWTGDLQEKYKGVVSDPAIILHKGRLILAAQSPDWGTVLSVHFKPKLDATTHEFELSLDRVLAGNLSLPQGLFDTYRDKLTRRVLSALPALQRKAALRGDGTANTDAMQAAMAKLLLSMLDGSAASPVLFLPAPGKGGVPVELTAVAIQDKSITLGIRLLDAEERRAALVDIRKPYSVKTDEKMTVDADEH